MSSNQRKNSNQRRNNYNNNNNQQPNTKNQPQKRGRYVAKYGPNTPTSSSSTRGYQQTHTQPNTNRQYSPKQAPKRYNQRSGGPSSPNNRANRNNTRDRNYNQYQNTDDPNNNDTNNTNVVPNNGQRFKLKPTTTHQRNENQYNTNPNNSNYRHNTNNNNNQINSNRSRRNANNEAYNNNSLNNEMPPGFNANTDNTQNYPPNRYRPNDTNNSERNRNWRNRFNPAPDAANASGAATDISPSFRPRNVNTNPRHGYNVENRGHHHSGSTQSHSRSPQSGPLSYNKQNVNDININISNASPGFQAHNVVGTPIYKASGSPLIGGQTVGTPRSASESAAQQTQNTNVATNEQNNGATSSDCAGSELFATLYGSNDVLPSIAYPVIKLCLNHEEGNDGNNLNQESKNARKYPVDWLLEIGKEIKEAPNHPKDDIPESVKFMHTIKIAGNKWKQKQNQITNVSPINIATNNRFGSIHQLTPNQLPQNIVPSPKIAKSSEIKDSDRSWRNPANLRLDKMPQNEVKEETENNENEVKIIKEANVETSMNKKSAKEQMKEITKDLAILHISMAQEKDVKPVEVEENDENAKNESIAEEEEVVAQEQEVNEVNESIAVNNNNVIDNIEVEAQLQAITDETVASNVLDEDSDDLDQYQVQHHTPELRPDPREIVDEDLNIAPEWDRDEGDEDTERIINTDFTFNVIDKDKEKAHFNKTGNLPQETATISHAEYELRQKEREKEVEDDAERPRKPPIPHGQTHAFNFHIDQRRGRPSLRSQSTPDHRSAYHEQHQEPLPIDKLPSRIRGIVIRLDEDIAKISSYIQQVALEKDQLNRYQRHLHKLIARRGQYANWWKTQQKKPNNNNIVNDDQQQQQQSSSSSSLQGGLRHATSLQQLEHYKDYYNKQLTKMKVSASTNSKFSTYVDYYRQKLKAVEKRQRELESRAAMKEVEATQKGASIIDVISKKDSAQAAPELSTNIAQLQAAKAAPSSSLIANPPLSNNPSNGDNEDPFASLMNLSEMGYTTATTKNTINTTNTIAAAAVDPQAQQTSQQQQEDAMWGYMYGGQAPPRHQAHAAAAQQAQHIQQAPVAAAAPPQQAAAAAAQSSSTSGKYSEMKQRNMASQKQKLKAYIRQHALKYVKPPPDPSDESYPSWYQGLRKVENIIYAKYMNKQRKRLEQAQAAAAQQKKDEAIAKNSTTAIITAAAPTITAPVTQITTGNLPRATSSPEQQHYGHPQYASSPYNHRVAAHPSAHPQYRQSSSSPRNSAQQQISQQAASHPYHHSHPAHSPPNINMPHSYQQQQHASHATHPSHQQSPYHHQHAPPPQQAAAAPHPPQQAHAAHPAHGSPQHGAHGSHVHNVHNVHHASGRSGAHSQHSHSRTHSHSPPMHHVRHPNVTNNNINATAAQHRMTHLNINNNNNISQQQQQQQGAHSPQSHHMHPQSLNSPSNMYHNNMNMSNMSNMSPPISPQQNNSKYGAYPQHPAAAHPHSPPNTHHAHASSPYAHAHHPQHPSYQHSPPNPNTTTTSLGYTTYNTQSPTNQPIQAHQYPQYPQ